MPHRVKSGAASPRGPAPRENPFACFEAFACLRPITTVDDKGHSVSTAEVTYSYPYRERRMLERFGSIDKMAFPTFDKGFGVAPLLGDGTFIFALTMEGRARGVDGAAGGARVGGGYGYSPANAGPSPTSSGENGGMGAAGASSAEGFHTALAAVGNSGANDADASSSSSSSSEEDCEEVVPGVRHVPLKERRRRRKEQEKEFKQLYGHCISTVNGEVFVFLSQHMWVGFFRSLLLYYRGNGSDAGRALLRALYAVPTPTDAGGSFGVRFGHSVLRRPMDYPHLRGIDADPLTLLQVFTDSQLCEIISALVLVETVIVCGPDFGIVSKLIVALRALIAPIDSNCWVFAPVLPRAMVGHLASPVPGIFGIIDDFMEEAREACATLSSAVFVQLRNTRPPAVTFVRNTNNNSSTNTPAAAFGVSHHDPNSDPNLIFSSSNTHSAVATPRSCSVGAGGGLSVSARMGRYRVPGESPPADGSIVCDSVAFLSTSHIPMPRTAGLVRSTLRRGLAALRSRRPQQRRAEDLLMLFVRYFAVHLGHVGSPLFSTAGDAIERYRSVNGSRGDCDDDVEFLRRFYESQTCVQMSEDLAAKVSASTQWTTDVFSNMVVQLNPQWYDAELSKYRREELLPVATKGSWELVTGGGESGRNGSGESGGWAATLLSWCCSRNDVLGGSDGEEEHGPSRATTATSVLTNRSSQGGLNLTPDGLMVLTSRSADDSSGGGGMGMGLGTTASIVSRQSLGPASSTADAEMDFSAIAPNAAMEKEMDDRGGGGGGGIAHDELAAYTRRVREGGASAGPPQ